MPPEGPAPTGSDRPEDLKNSPRQAYREARGHLVYRLSDLIWGSLLASYILGFLSLAAGAWLTYPHAININALLSVATENTMAPDVMQGIREVVLAYNHSLASHAWVPWFRVFTYLSISVAFIYLAAGLYHAYHLVVLTRPTAPLERIRLDFALACVQAVSFGLSMIAPSSFPAFVAFVLLLASLRHRSEHRSFATRLFRTTKQPQEERYKDHFPAFKNALRDEMAPSSMKRKARKDHPLAFWVPSWPTPYLAGLGLLFGILWGFNYESLQAMLCQKLSPDTPPPEIGVALVAGVVATVVVWSQWGVLGTVPQLLNEHSATGMAKLDQDYGALKDWARRWQPSEGQ